MPFLQRLISAAVRHPVPALLLAAGVVAGLAWPVTSVPTDNSLAVWFVEGDPALERYRAFQRTFGNDEAVVLAYRDPGALDSAGLALLDRAARAVGAVEGVDAVLSPAPLVRLAGREAARPVLERLGLAGPDGAVALVATVAAAPDLDARRGRLLDGIEAAVDSTLGAAGHTVHRAGIGVVYEGLNRLTEAEGALFLGLAVGIMVLVLWGVLGSGRAVALTLAPPLAATVATTGLVGWTGGSLNVVMATLPALILVIGVADGVHILLAWFAARRAHPPEGVAERRERVAEVVGRLAVPCLYTSLTTALAFLALTSSRMAVLRALGLYAAAGVLLVWLLAVVGMAAGLSLLAVPAPARAPGAWLGESLGRLGPWLRQRRAWVLAGAAVVLTVMAWGAARVEVDTHTLGLLPDDHPVVRDSRWIEDRLGAYTPLEFVVRRADAGTPAGRRSVLAPELLAGVARWQRAAEAAGIGVDRTLSLADLLAWTGPAAETEADAGRRLDELSELMGPGLSAWITPDREALRLTAFVPMGTARDFAAAVDTLGALGEAALTGTGAELRATGYLPLYVRIIDYTVSSTLSGLALAFAGVFLVLALLLRSGRLVAAAIPPNLLAVATVFGAMGWLGIPLDIATATVGAIVLGIAVDDTVHFLHHYRQDGSVPAALRIAGPGMVLTSAVLVLGLAVLLAASSLSVVYFGGLIILAVSAALAADLLVLPVILPSPEPEGGPR